MIAQGLTTFPEQADDPRSDCHAWSSSPMIEFLATVCGIEPAEPGFKTVRVQPYLGGLTEASAVVPHPSGDIAVKLRRKGAKGITAEISLPKDLTGEFLWNGERVALKPGKQIINK
jgi:hypothetical protein